MADTGEQHRPSEYEHETTGGREYIAEVLNGVVDGVLAGSIRIGPDADAVDVAVPDEISLEIELEEEDDEVSLELELEWPATDVEPRDLESEGVRGDAEEPRQVAAADGTESLARFELYRDRAEEWRWRLRHRNGEVIADGGEGYTSKQNAVKGIRSVVENSPEAEVTEASTES